MPPDAFAPEQQGLTPQEAAQKLIARGYRLGEPGKTHRQLAGIKGPKEAPKEARGNRPLPAKTKARVWTKGKPGKGTKIVKTRTTPEGETEYQIEVNREVSGTERLFAPRAPKGKGQPTDSIVVVRDAEGREAAIFPAGTEFSKMPKDYTVTTEVLPTAPSMVTNVSPSVVPDAIKRQVDQMLAGVETDEDK